MRFDYEKCGMSYVFDREFRIKFIFQTSQRVSLVERKTTNK